MTPHFNILNTLESLEYSSIKTNKKIEYINLANGFDIETTSTYIDGNKCAFMYVWMLGIGHGEEVYYGRTWDDFITTCETVSTFFNLSESRRLIIYVHNLGYEFQFMRKYFTWIDVFSGGERKPLKALCSLGIEFRCSYILSGFSLSNTAKNLVKHTIYKKEGDLDYSLIRTHETDLTALELGYCKSDIEIITAYIDEQMDIYKDISKIPLTNTGRVRKYVRNECYYSNKNHRKSSKSKYTRYRKIMNDLTLDVETYRQMKRAFMGGFTHANALYTGKVLKDVTSIDFTSSYPSVMVSEKFPMSRFRSVVINNEKELEYYCHKHALIFDVKFINIKTKIRQDSYISESKCMTIINPLINNGRVSEADELTTTITNIDYDIIKQVYKWDSIELANVKYSHINYLPKSIIESTLSLYQDKTVLKDVEGSEIEYLLSKGMLNSIYGMCVTDIVQDRVTYDDDWEVEEVDYDEAILDYNTSKNRFLYYAWGLWITAHARKNLWTGIIAVGDDYIYSDTDSLKILNYNNHKKYIKWFDNLIIDKASIMCNHYKINTNLLYPKTKDGVIKPLGVWDYEGTYEGFKTLGAKRYLIYNKGRFNLTVAGLSKTNGVEYMLEEAGGCVETVFNMFNNSLYIPSNKTGKMTHTYLDDEIETYITDYNEHKTWVTSLSSIHLEPCEFTLSISQQYLKFIENLAKGYLYKGLQYI